MSTISSSDILCAEASFHGRRLVSFTSTGFGSFNDVLQAIRRSIGSVAGFITFSVFNRSRGWRECRSMYITPEPAGVQLTFNF